MTNTITPLEFSLRDERNRAEVTVETFTPPPDPLLFECWKENWGDGRREKEGEMKRAPVLPVGSQLMWILLAWGKTGCEVWFPRVRTALEINAYEMGAGLQHLVLEGNKVSECQEERSLPMARLGLTEQLREGTKICLTRWPISRMSWFMLCCVSLAISSQCRWPCCRWEAKSREFRSGLFLSPFCGSL